MVGNPDKKVVEPGETQYREIFNAADDGLVILDLETSLVVEANSAAYRMHGYTGDQFIGMEFMTFIHPESQHVFNESIRIFQSDGVFDLRALHIRRDGSSFYAEWRGTAFEYQGQPCLLGIVRDVSNRIQIEQRLGKRVEIRTHEQATLLEISHTLASTLELQPGLILDQLRKIIEYDYGGLFALEESTLVTLAIRGAPHLEHLAPIRIPLNTPETLAALFNQHQPIRIANIWSETTQAQFLRFLINDDASVLLVGMQSWMWVPLAVKGRIIGGIGVAHRQQNYFTSHLADLALSVANQAAITMINAELYGHAQELAVLEERQRLARNLHDAVNQSLFSAGLIAEVLPRLWARDSEAAQQSLEDLRRLTRGAMAEMRALLAELRPSTLTDSSLSDLLRLLGNAFSGRTNIPVNVDIMGEFFLPAEVQVAFYRICQEGLNNIAKHARPSRVEIGLKQIADEIEMRICDDGVGFDTQKIVSGHYGLSMMRERAEAAGAVFVAVSQSGQGTELLIRWTKSPAKESK
ncbi:MAG: PAS domain S-box protein [Chloroflexi bacterium]|nr:PAS domain S-box protein [Chloroflexota bacterium]